MVYYAATMLVAAVVGLVVVNVLEPGVGIDTAGLALNASEAPQSDLQDVALGFVGSNVFASMAQMQLVPVILFSLFFGAVLTTIGEQGSAAGAHHRRRKRGDDEDGRHCHVDRARGHLRARGGPLWSRHGGGRTWRLGEMKWEKAGMEEYGRCDTPVSAATMYPLASSA